ncbi:MAG: acetylglutamate kinase [Candidatus Promineifilaceae bacterium]|jgi:acetylglutamate kinase
MNNAIMDDSVKKATVLIEALPYIQRFKGAIFVVKFGGSTMEDPTHSEGILTDLTFLSCVGVRPVVVHGGGKAISKGMRDEGIETRFVKGLRVTCEKSMKVVERVMGTDINPGIVAMIEAGGGVAKGVSGQDVFHVNRKSGIDPDTGEPLDWGFVGEPSEVDAKPVLDVLASGAIPVVTPIGIGADGKAHNINADTAAAALAKAIGARKLVYLTDVPGLLRDLDDTESIMSTLSVSEVADLMGRGVIEGGMLPKVESAVGALAAGVKKVHMIDGRQLHSLLLEIFTDKGVGTQIVP